MEQKRFIEALPLKYSDFFSHSESQCCPKCDETFPTTSLLEIHWQKIHKGLPLLKCCDCSLVFKKKRVLISHWRSSLNHNSVKLVACLICDAFSIISGFKTEQDLISHTKKIHGEEVLCHIEGQTKYPCPMPGCKSEFSYRKGVVEHLQVSHGDHLLQDLLRVPESKKDFMLDTTKHKCNHCGGLFRMKESLDQHMALKHPGTPSAKSPNKKQDGATDSLPRKRGRPVGTKRRLDSPSTQPPRKVARFSSPAVSTTSLKRKVGRPPSMAKQDTTTIEAVKTPLRSVCSTPLPPQKGSTPLPQKSSTPVPSQKGSTPLPQKGSTPLHQKGLTPLPRKSSTPLASTNSSQVECSVCKKTFTRQSVLNIHVQMVHQKTSVPPKTVLTLEASITSPIKQKTSRLNSSHQGKVGRPPKNGSRLSLDPNAMRLTVKSEKKEIVQNSIQTEQSQISGSVKRGRGRPRKLEGATTKIKIKPTTLANKLKKKYQALANSKIQQGIEDKKASRKRTLDDASAVPKKRIKKETVVKEERISEAETEHTEKENSDPNVASQNENNAEKRKDRKTLLQIFDKTYFAEEGDANGTLSEEFYGEPPDVEDMDEECIIRGCKQKFLTYFSMMRHVAFSHRPEVTAKLMKLVQRSKKFHMNLRAM